MGSFKYPKKDEVIVEFSITDSGIGISKENFDKVFESFSQEGTYINRRFGGTGLGLAITKRFVEIQKGKINLKSEPGKGSTFAVSIPYLIPKNISKTKKEIKQTNELLYYLEGAKILLVEDNPMNQMIAETFLTKWNAKVSIANNGLEALAALKQETFNVVLMDIQMPVMDGYEATRKIRLNKRFDNLPIIALTASAMVEVRNKITAAGMNNMVTKPFEPKELFTAVLKSLYK